MNNGLIQAHSKVSNSNQLVNAQLVRIKQIEIQTLLDAGYRCVVSSQLRSIYATPDKCSIALCRANKDFTFSATIMNSRDNVVITN